MCVTLHSDKDEGTPLFFSIEYQKPVGRIVMTFVLKIENTMLLYLMNLNMVDGWMKWLNR